MAERFVILLEQGIDECDQSSNHMTNSLSSSSVGLRSYSEYTFPVVNGRKPTSASSSQSCRCSVGAKDVCQRTARPFLEATKADIIAYIDDMTHRSNPKGENIRYLHSGVGLANSTMQQRLTVVRLLYDYLIDERLRLDQRNPVGKGKFTPGRAFAGKRERGILRHYEQLPWIPGSDEWDRILDATLQEPLRNRLMLLFAYDGALRSGGAC